MNKTTLTDEVFCALLKERGLNAIDKRDKGGLLWVVGGHELDAVMDALGELGYIFLYNEKGGRSTKGKPGWYLRKKNKQFNKRDICFTKLIIQQESIASGMRPL